MQTRIAILGFARTYTEAPFEDPSVAIWGMNELYKLLPRWDAWFELHDTHYLGRTARVETPDEPERHVNWLKAQPAGKPIYMLRVFPDIAASVAYPIEAMCARFGRYFTSTIGYMMAVAIAQIVDARVDPKTPGPDEWIGLFGVDLASDNEHAAQRPNAEYFVGLARGMGITVFVPEHGAITHAPGLYGFEPAPEHQGLVSEYYLAKHLKQYKDKLGNAQAHINTLDGVCQAYGHVWTHRDRPELATREQVLDFCHGQYEEKRAEHDQEMANFNTLNGVIQAATHYLQICGFKKRGVYVPESDPFYVASTSEAASTSQAGT